MRKNVLGQMSQTNPLRDDIDSLDTQLVYTSPSMSVTKAPSVVDCNRQIVRYREWLNNHATATQQHSVQRQAARLDYEEAALRTVIINNKPIRTFAPFRLEYSALQTFSRSQILLLLFICLFLSLGFVLSLRITLIIIMSLVTILYLGDLILQFVMSLRTLMKDFEEHIDETVIAGLTNVEWPSYTILCPLYKEAAVVPQFIKAIRKLDYPLDKLQILLLLEENDVETLDALSAMQLPAHFSIVLVPAGSPQTKPRACNAGLIKATGEYIVIYDAEDVMDPLQLKRAILAFANHDSEIVCVQAKLNFYNSDQNLLTRWFTAEYSSWFDLLLPGLQYLRFPLPLGGTSNHFRTEVLRALGGWDAFNVTEDCELGIRLSQFHFKTVILNSTTFEEANSQWRNWLRQRSRWLKGYMQTYLVHMRHPLHMLRQHMFREFLALQFLVGGRTLAVFVNPVLWITLTIYIFFRSHVETFYHEIFPPAVLYMGAFCLILGNFFYIYTHLFGCVRRHQYHLVKWALLIPIYWLMMSIAGSLALFQIVVKPHYWEKTIHGLHLKHHSLSSTQIQSGNPSTVQRTLIIDQFDELTNADQSPLPPLSAIIKRLPAHLARAFSTIDQQALQRPAIVARDLWLLLITLVACLASILSSFYFFLNSETLLYDDAYSHIRIARSVVDSITPGFAQLGGVWLPLHHLLMLPFIWNDTLWQTGFAGSIPSMVAYVVACIYLFLLIRTFTHHNIASFLGTLIFLLNPNVLYLQATALSEILCASMVLLTSYYFVLWIQEDHIKFLVLSALGTLLTSLIRYDGWALFMVMLAAITIISLWKKQRLRQIEGNLLLFGTMGSFGISLWLLWCYIIFGDALYFQRGPYSAQAQQLKYLQAHALYSYHDVWQSIRYYGLDALETIGGLLFILAGLAIIFFFIRYRLTPTTLAAATLLTPFAFYSFSLYSGQAILYLPQALPASVGPQWFNVRYGVQMVGPLAFFLGIGLANLRLPRQFRPGRSALYALFITLVLAQSFVISDGRNLALNDGLYNHNCASTSRPIHAYLAQHYNGRLILTDEYATQINGLVFGAHLSSFVYEGSGPKWLQTLAHPEQVVDWVIMRPDDATDLVAQAIQKNYSSFLANFSRVIQEKNGLRLYLHNGVHDLPNRPLPTNILNNQRLCNQYSGYSY